MINENMINYKILNPSGNITALVIDDYKGSRVPKEYFIGKRPGGHGDTIQGRSADGYFFQVGFFINGDGAIKGGYSQGGWSMAAPKVTAIYYR